MPTSPSSGRAGQLLLLLVIVALAIGAAAVFLAGPVPGVAHAPSVGGVLDVSIPIWVAALLALLPILVVILGTFLRGRAEGSVTVPGRFLAVVLVGLMLLLLFIILSHGANSGGSLYYVVSAPGNNTTSNGSNVTGHGTPLGPNAVGWTVPAWAMWVVVGVIVALVSVVGWGLAARRPPRGAARGPPPLAADPETRAALSEAAGALEHGQDPRTVILRLYARLLARVTPWTGDLGPWTPEEIRVVRLASIGLSGASVVALTRLFEEARYSSHPMGAASAADAVRSIRQIEQEIDRRGAAS